MKESHPGGGDPSVLDNNYPPTNCWPEAPWGGGGGGGGGGALEGGFREGRWGGSRRGRGGGGGAPGGSVGGGGVQVQRFGVVVGGPGGAIWGGGGWAQAPLTSACPPSNHIKTEYWDRAGGGGNIRYEW